MDLDSAADDLYGVAPEEFVERRKVLVGEARQAKDRELVRQIGALRKPTRTGWLVNVLARAEPDAVRELLDLGRALALAQQRRSGDDLRRLSQQRRSMVDALARRTLELGRERGYEPPDASHQEVAQSLQAALGDPEVAGLLLRGRLTQAVTYGGFGMGELAAAAPPDGAAPAAAVAAVPDPDPGAGSSEPEPDADEHRRTALEQRLREAERARDESQAALEAGVAEADRLTTAADDLADRVENLRTRLAEAQDAEQTARDRARSARGELSDRRSAVAQAEQVTAEIRAALGPSTT